MASVCWLRLWTFLVYIVNFLPSFFAFNLDTQIPIIKIGNRESYFGFSVAQHLVRNDVRGVAEPWVLVGAPRDNVTHFHVPYSVRSIVRPGAVYKCPFTADTRDCELVNIDQEEIRGSALGKTDQWLGVSVASQGTIEGKAVACAHRYQLSGATFRWGLGHCISMSNDLQQEDYMDPCGSKSTAAGHGEYGMCQAGASSSISEDGDLLIGAPGPFNWRGTVFKNILQTSLTEEPKWLNSPVEDRIPNVPGPEPATGYYSYLGLSVKIGNIINGRKTYVAGAPRSKDSGQVLLFQPARDYLRVEARHYLTGEQFGSCFGYDLAIGDFNSDGRDDLVVAAPFYHDVGIGGAIYIYLNSPQGITKDTKPMRITSRKMREMECNQLNCINARFGFALSNIGDVNRDGYADLAVSAPYEGDGAVYIFHGSSAGIKKDYSQRIYASNLTSEPLTTFGISLSGGKDFDLNGYPDLVVGAFDSNKIVMLRSRPVINVNATFVSNPRRIDPRQKVCEKDKKKNNCFELNICFKYSAEPKERFSGPVDLEYKIEAEKFTGAHVARVFFKGTPEDQDHIRRNAVLRRQNEEQCTTHMVYVKEKNLDFLNAIQFRLTYQLKSVPPPRLFANHQLPDINSYPILDPSVADIPLSVHFIKNCVHESECLSNLNVSGSFEKLDKDQAGDYVLRVGLIGDLQLDVIVGNSEEEAHETMLYVTHPPSLVYIGLDDRGKHYSCTPLKEVEVIACAIENPLHSGQQAKFGIRFDPKQVPATMRMFNISLLVNTTSKETNLLNDGTVVKVKVIVEADIQVYGKSNPKEVFFSGEVVGASAIKTEEQIGNEIIHSYEVWNLFGGRVGNSTLVIKWPYEKIVEGHVDGKHLLYLMDAPHEHGPVTCPHHDPFINRLNVSKNESALLKKDQEQDARVSSARERRLVKRSRDEELTETTADGRSITVAHLDCDGSAVKCHEIVCKVGELGAGESVVVKLRFRLWRGTFLEHYTAFGRIYVSSKAEIRIDPSLNIQQPDPWNDVSKAVTIVQPSVEVQASPGVDLWIIIVAVCAGLLLLILLIILFWKCGFFRRKKPDEMAQHKAKLESQKNYPDYPD